MISAIQEREKTPAIPVDFINLRDVLQIVPSAKTEDKGNDIPSAFRRIIVLNLLTDSVPSKTPVPFPAATIKSMTV